MSVLRVAVLFERSGVVREALRARGVEAISCDLAGESNRQWTEPPRTIGHAQHRPRTDVPGDRGGDG